MSVRSVRFYLPNALLLILMSVATFQLHREVVFYRHFAGIEEMLRFTSGPSMPTLRERMRAAKRSHLRRSVGWSVACGGSAVCLWLHLRRFREPPQPGLCPICGYDLRASPGRCPECGTPPQAA